MVPNEQKEHHPANIYPITMMTREDKENLLGQRGIMVWFTGLSGSGKSTVALGVERELRRENIRRIAEVGKLFVQTGIVTLACFVSPTNDIRQLARDIIGSDDFLEVYVSTPIEECERRDVKGLYARARRGEVKDFTGISAPFEAPLYPSLSIDTSRLSLEDCVQKVVQLITNHNRQK